MACKHDDKFRTQWDKYLSGLLWAYRNTPHESTGEKPSCLLFGVNCRTPFESALLPPSSLNPTDVTEYREELALSLSSARNLAAFQIQKAQSKYKKCYDRKAKPSKFKIGEWVLVRFPHEETGRMRKLSRPWHGPFRIVSRSDPDVTVSNVYFPSDAHIKVHQNRVSHCPDKFPAGYYCYGGKRKGTGTPPKWVDNLFNQSECSTSGESGSSTTGENEASETSQSEEQNDNVSGDEMDEEQDMEPETDTGESVDTQLAQDVTPPRSERSRYSLRASMRKPNRFT